MPRSTATSTPANLSTSNPTSQSNPVTDAPTDLVQRRSVVDLTLSDSQSIHGASRPPSQRTRTPTERQRILENDNKEKKAKSKKNAAKKAQRARRRLRLIVSSPDNTDKESHGNAMSDSYSEGTSAAYEEGSEAGESQDNDTGLDNTELDNAETQYIDRRQLLHDLAAIARLDVETCQLNNYEVMEVLRGLRNAPDTQAPPDQTQERQTQDVVLPSAQLNQGSGSRPGADKVTVPGPPLKRKISAQALRADSAKRSRVRVDPNNTDTVSESDDESPRPVPYAQRIVIGPNHAFRPTTAAPPVSSPVTVHANELLGSSEWQPIDLRSDHSSARSSRASSIAPTSRPASQPPVGRPPAPSQSHSLGSSIERATAARSARLPPPRPRQDADPKSDSDSNPTTYCASNSDTDSGDESNLPSARRIETARIFFGPARRRFRSTFSGPTAGERPSRRRRAFHGPPPPLTSNRAREIRSLVRTSGQPALKESPTRRESDLLPNNEEAIAQAEASASGTRLHSKSKPAARDVTDPNERQVLTAAKIHFAAYIATHAPFENRATYRLAAREVHETTWGDELPGVRYRPPPDWLIDIMVRCLATARGRFKELMRPVIKYNYRFIHPATSQQEVNRNLKRFRRIHPNAFHCARLRPPCGHYESRHIFHAFAAAFFSGPTAPGVLYRSYFRPVPIQTIAFVLAIMQFCIEEWKTGRFVPCNLSIANMHAKYVCHLDGLEALEQRAPRRFTTLQQDLYAFGIHAAEATGQEQNFVQEVTLPDEIRPDSPEPEPEPEYTEDGRLTARSKGKGRAD